MSEVSDAVHEASDEPGQAPQNSALRISRVFKRATFWLVERGPRMSQR